MSKIFPSFFSSFISLPLFSHAVFLFPSPRPFSLDSMSVRDPSSLSFSSLSPSSISLPFLSVSFFRSQSHLSLFLSFFPSSCTPSTLSVSVPPAVQGSAGVTGGQDRYDSAGGDFRRRMSAIQRELFISLRSAVLPDILCQGFLCRREAGRWERSEFRRVRRPDARFDPFWRSVWLCAFTCCQTWKYSLRFFFFLSNRFYAAWFGFYRRVFDSLDTS